MKTILSQYEDRFSKFSGWLIICSLCFLLSWLFMDSDVRFGVKRTWTNTTLIFVTIEQKNGDRNRCPIFEPDPKWTVLSQTGLRWWLRSSEPKGTVILLKLDGLSGFWFQDRSLSQIVSITVLSRVHSDNLNSKVDTLKRFQSVPIRNFLVAHQELGCGSSVHSDFTF